MPGEGLKKPLEAFTLLALLLLLGNTYSSLGRWSGDIFLFRANDVGYRYGQCTFSPSYTAAILVFSNDIYTLFFS